MAITMSSQAEQPKRKIERKEEKLYEPIVSFLKIMFGKYVEKDVEAEKKLQRDTLSFPDENLYLEITANGRFSEMLKEQLDDRALSIINVEKFSPDIMGFVRKNKSSPKELITVEVKAQPITLKNISRAKLYQDIFRANYGLLVSTSRISEELRRFILDRHAIRGNLIIAQYLEGYKVIRIHPSFEYHLPKFLQEFTKHT
jgi:hypothetical protein